MKLEEVRTHKERLLALRKRLHGDMQPMLESVRIATCGRGRMSGSIADIAGNQFDQDMAAHLLVAKEQTLDRIERALEDIEDGTYGVCRECGRNINKLRLRAVPYATECVRCA